jgi:hypothetical protein
MKTERKKWRLVTDASVERYKCGLKAGDRLLLLLPINVRRNGKLTGLVHMQGEIWTVLRGSKESPGVIWLKQPDGKLHTWDDNLALFKTFELLRELQKPSKAR